MYSRVLKTVFYGNASFHMFYSVNGTFWQYAKTLRSVVFFFKIKILPKPKLILNRERTMVAKMIGELKVIL